MPVSSSSRGQTRAFVVQASQHMMFPSTIETRGGFKKPDFFFVQLLCEPFGRIPAMGKRLDPGIAVPLGCWAYSFDTCNTHVGSVYAVRGYNGFV